MNKRFATLGLLAGLSALSTGALAYQFEASGFYFDFDDLDDSALAVEGAYFFAPVDDEGIPRAEAAFLGQASNIGLGFATVDEADEDILFLGGELYIQQFYAAAGLTRIEVGNTESDDLSLEVGFVPAKGLRLTAGYDNDDLLDLSRISLNAKMVRPLSGQQAFNAEFTVGKTDDNEDTIDYGLVGDFFINHDLSFGLGYSDTDADNSNEAITLRARWFLIPTLSLQLQYNAQDFNDFMVLGVTGRF